MTERELIEHQRLGDAAPRLIPTSPFATFTVDLSQPGQVGVVVNDQDVSAHVRRAVVMSAPGEMSTLQLEVRGTGRIEGQGVVQVLLDSEGGSVAESDAVVRFLDSVDPVELSALALTSASGMGSDPIEQMLTALKSIAAQSR